MFYVFDSFYFSEGNLRSPARQCEYILSWASRKLAWASGILYRTYKGYLFSGKCSRNLVSQAVLDTLLGDVYRFISSIVSKWCMLWFYMHSIRTLLMLNLQHAQRTWLIQLLLMLWFFMSLGHCRTCTILVAIFIQTLGYSCIICNACNIFMLLDIADYPSMFCPICIMKHTSIKNLNLIELHCIVIDHTE